jgi:HK97 gp10 family phage protein
VQIHLHEYGLDDLLLRVNSLADPARARATRRRMLRAGIRVIERETKALLTGNRSGRTYTFRGVTHQASAPGEPPAVDTGNLKNSLRVLEVTDERASFGTSADYAAYLEFGTRYMEARPFLRPAADNSVEEIARVMTAIADEALNGR